MRVSLIISTYNRPAALRLVLQSVRAQSILPFEVIIADDGSDESTRTLITEEFANFPTTLIHAHQEDLGFRLAKVRNLGVSKSSGDYLIFVDGDLILHPKFVESHLRFARPKQILLGSRVMLPKSSTQKALAKRSIQKFGLSDVKASHILNKIHSNFLSRILTRTNSKASARGCNFSLNRTDYYAVNGFNEDFSGWGLEDSEFVWRLELNGVSKTKLRCCAVTFHLDHALNYQLKFSDQFAVNEALFAEVRKLGKFQCSNGLNNHSTAPVVLQEN